MQGTVPDSNFTENRGSVNKRGSDRLERPRPWPRQMLDCVQKQTQPARCSYSLQSAIQICAAATSSMQRQNSMRFLKMHGLGNDFVIVDARGNDSLDLSRLVARIGDRRRGVGFDQLAVIRASGKGDARVDFWNQDGSASATCGNATRCVGRLLINELGRDRVTLETSRGSLTCEDAGADNIRVNMGRPAFGWKDIPLAEEIDSFRLPLEGEPCALGLGNPHCVFFVPDAETAALEEIGPRIERHPLFPERTNVEFVTVRSAGSIRMRIWERGAGVTPASGSGACAAAVAAHRRGLAGRKASVETDGGQLSIDWRDDGVWKTGPVCMVFEGRLSPEWLARP